MKINKILGVFVILLALLCAPKVSAFTSSSGKKWNPNITLNTPAYSPTYSLKTKYTTITGPHCYVYFSDRTDLPSYFASTNDRIMHISLYEEDAGNNADDLVKLYTYKFKGRLMDGVTWELKDPGNIDSSGDQYGELYLQFMLYDHVDDTAGDRGTGSFFKYEIAVD